MEHKQPASVRVHSSSHQRSRPSACAAAEMKTSRTNNRATNTNAAAAVSGAAGARTTTSCSSLGTNRTLSWPIPALSVDRRVPRVVVIGAGASGLAAAHSLVYGTPFGAPDAAPDAAGMAPTHKARLTPEVIVIEGRHRLGGRIHSIQMNDDNSTVVDLGASWIHGVSGNPLTIIGPKAGLTLGPLDDVGGPNNKSIYYDIDGKLYDDAIEADFKQMVYQMLEKSRVIPANARAAIPGPPLKTSWDTLCSASHMKRLASKHGMDVDTVRRLAATYADGFESYMAAPMSSINMNWLWDHHERDQNGGDRVVVNGYYRLIDYLATGISIYTNTCVTKIESIVATPADHGAGAAGHGAALTGATSTDIATSPSASSSPPPLRRTQPTVRITTNQGVVEADYVVCTLPIGVLRSGSVTFSPPLPKGKCQAIQRFGWGTLDKVVLRFSKCFWPSDATWILCSSDRAAGPSQDVVWFQNYQRCKRIPVLVGFIHSSYAIDMENDATMNGVSDAHGGVRDAIDALSRSFPRRVVQDSLLESYVTQWSNDIFSMGSYTHIGTTGSAVDYEEMARCTGPLHFAGEATNRQWPCTVHGAFLSGAREAKKIKKRIVDDWPSK